MAQLDCLKHAERQAEDQYRATATAAIQPADLIAQYLSGFADIDSAIAYARNYAYDRHNDTSDMLAVLLAERARRAEASETLDERAFRLGLKAAELDATADDLRAEAAQDDLVVTVRRLRNGGNDQPAMSIERRAAATRMRADIASAESERLRSQARAIRNTQALIGLVQERGAA